MPFIINNYCALAYYTVHCIEFVMSQLIVLMYMYVVAASSGLDGCIKLWELETGKLLKSIDGGPGGPGLYICIQSFWQGGNGVIYIYM